MDELLEWMDYIEDKRQQTKVQHKLKDIIVIVLFATLVNVDDWVEMEYFAHYHEAYLKKYIELKNGIPSHDTLCRVFGMLSPEILQQLYGKWQELLNQNEGEVLRKRICIDGKTMRSNKRKEGKPNHIITAWSKEDGFSLGQKVVNTKSNEITAIPELLEKIRIKGQVVTIDAMGTQTAIAEKIRLKRGDYVLALKEDANTTLDKQAAENLNIIRKWCLSILKMVEIFRPNLSMKKKRFVISMNPAEFLEQVLNF